MPKKKIILVEDEGIVSSDLSFFLDQEGYQVTGAVFTGEDALECCRNDPPDAALIDIGLNGKMDGIETARKIRKEFQTPIIYITGFADEKTISRARQTGPEAVLLKPIDEDKLKTVLKQVFQTPKSS